MDSMFQWWVWLAWGHHGYRSFQADVTAIVFVVSCSSFDTVIREDGKTVSVLCFWGNSLVMSDNTIQNSLQESLELFDNIWTNR